MITEIVSLIGKYGWAIQELAKLIEVEGDVSDEEIRQKINEIENWIRNKNAEEWKIVRGEA